LIVVIIADAQYDLIQDIQNTRDCFSDQRKKKSIIHPIACAEATANLLTNDALDLQALIPEFKACAVQVLPARHDEVANPEVEVRRGRY